MAGQRQSKVDGISSDQVRDLSPSGHHGTHFNHEDKPVQADGGVAGGKCMLFYDSGSLIELPTGTIVTGNSPRTVCFWLKRRQDNSLDGQDYAFGFGSSSVSQSFNSRFGGGKMGFMGYGVDHARQDSAEHFCRLKVHRCTAMGWIFIPRLLYHSMTGRRRQLQHQQRQLRVASRLLQLRT